MPTKDVTVADSISMFDRNCRKSVEIGGGGGVCLSVMAVLVGVVLFALHKHDSVTHTKMALINLENSDRLSKTEPITPILPASALRPDFDSEELKNATVSDVYTIPVQGREPIAVPVNGSGYEIDEAVTSAHTDAEGETHVTAVRIPKTVADATTGADHGHSESGDADILEGRSQQTDPVILEGETRDDLSSEMLEESPSPNTHEEGQVEEGQEEEVEEDDVAHESSEPLKEGEVAHESPEPTKEGDVVHESSEPLF